MAFDEAGHADLELAGGAGQLALGAVQVQAQGGVRAGVDRQGLACPVDHLGAGVATGQTLDQIDADLHMLGRGGDG